MLAIRKPFAVGLATRATLAGSTSIHGHQLSSSIFSFVRQFCKECRPCCIVHRFRKRPTRQALHVRVLHYDRSVVVDDASGQPVFENRAVGGTPCGASWLRAARPCSSVSKTSCDRKRGLLYPRPEGRGFTAARINAFFKLQGCLQRLGETPNSCSGDTRISPLEMGLSFVKLFDSVVFASSGVSRSKKASELHVGLKSVGGMKCRNLTLPS